MALIDAYLVSWVAGGVLLAGDLLLTQARSARAPEELTTPAPEGRPSPAWHVLSAMAALGFGGAGLALEAVGGLGSSQRPAAAAGTGLALLVLAYWLARPRGPELV